MKTNSMKMKRVCYLMMLLFIGTGAAFAQSKKERRKQKELRVKEIIESENYKIDVTTAYPRRGRMIPLTSLYSLEIRNDSVFSQLPYFGRAYSIPYGGGSGLMFKAPIEKYQMIYNKRGVAKAELTARSEEDKIKFYFTVYPDGSSNIDATMQQRESIRFSGELVVPEKTE